MAACLIEQVANHQQSPDGGKLLSATMASVAVVEPVEAAAAAASTKAAAAAAALASVVVVVARERRLGGWSEGLPRLRRRLLELRWR